MTTYQPMAFTFTPAERVRGQSPYQPGARAPWVDLVLDANEGPALLPEQLTELPAIDADAVRQYPSTASLEQTIAERFGINPARVIVTNGGDDAIDRICRIALEPGRTLVAHTPTFEMIIRSAKLAGARIDQVAWTDGVFPLPEFVDRIKESTGLVSIVTPNNPTGRAVQTESMIEVAAAARHAGALVLVDLAYVEFADEDPTTSMLALDNVLIVRTFSKAFGLAGLRVGYTIVPESIAPLIRAVGGPYPVSAPSLRIAEIMFRQADRPPELASVVREQRADIAGVLSRLGCIVSPSQANFILARTPRAEFLWQGLRALGISVRRFTAQTELQDALRITLPGGQQEYDRLRQAIETTLAPEAILFDLDGVLADVSTSYREAIIRTAADYGATATPNVIQNIKDAGNANNDWLVTQRIIADQGITAPLEEIVERFQQHYLGSTERPGLRERESLIPSPELLRSLASRFKLAVVTGRPRFEARWFLDRFGLTDLFGAVVCMEDAAAKPSPEPVLRAMDQLGVSAAWMIGDTPDDIIAARTAAALPVGITAPGQETTRQTLTASGAARVLDTLEELTEILP